MAVAPSPGVSLWVVTPAPTIVSSSILTATIRPMSPPYPFPKLSRTTVLALPSNLPTKNFLSISPSLIANRSLMGSLDTPFRIALIAGPFTNFSCCTSIRAAVAFRRPESMPPERTDKTVRTTTMFINSRILNNLSKRFGPDFVNYWINKVHKQDRKNHTVNI